MPSIERIYQLIEKSRSQELDASEKQELEEWLSLSKDDYKEELEMYARFKEEEKKSLPSLLAKKQGQAFRYARDKRKWRKRNNSFVKFETIIGLFIFIGTLLVTHFFLRGNRDLFIPMEPVFPPGTTFPPDAKAILLLDDKRCILLDTCKNGFLAEQGNIRLSYKDKTVIYEMMRGRSPARRRLFNQLMTCGGGQCGVQLIDGSKISLNAASSIWFTLPFEDDERRVEMTGEAFFDVNAAGSNTDTRSKFTVGVTSAANNNLEVEALGTQFNINAYGDEHDIITTLMKGKIRISGENLINLMHPGSQLRTSTNGDYSIVPVDTAEVTGWKKGEFYFNDKPALTIFKEVARWYGLELKLEMSGDINGKYIMGVSRSIPLNEVVRFLNEMTTVSIEVKNKQLIVRNRPVPKAYN